MNKKLILPIAMIVIIGIVFYGGFLYGKNKSSFSQRDFQNLRNLTPEERQQRIGQLGIPGAGRGNGAQGSGFVSGDIIAKDEKSVTIKLRDGGSKIVFFSDSTEVGKFVIGTVADLEIGKTVSVNGQANSDGSVTASSIQIRPAMPANTTSTPSIQ